MGSREISAVSEEVVRNGVNPSNIPLFAGFNSPRSGIPAEERCYEISVKVDRYPLPGALRDLRKNSYRVLMMQDQCKERYCILYTERAKQSALNGDVVTLYNGLTDHLHPRPNPVESFAFVNCSNFPSECSSNEAETENRINWNTKLISTMKENY